MKKNYRVKRDKDFQRLFKTGKSFANRQFVIYMVDSGQAHFRLGLSVSKRLGNAVTRNTIKRRLRHLVQELSPRLANYDLVIIARKGVEDMSYDQMRRHLHHVLNLSSIYEENNQ